MMESWADLEAPGRLPVQEEEEVLEEEVVEREARPAPRQVPTTLCVEAPESLMRLHRRQLALEAPEGDVVDETLENVSVDSMVEDVGF